MLHTDMLINALINDQVISALEGQTLLENARIAHMDLADFLYHHTAYDSARIAHAFARYVGCKTVSLADMQDPHLINHVIHAKINDHPIVAIYKAANLIHIPTTREWCVISALDYFKLYKTITPTTSAQQTEETIIEQLDAILLEGISKHASDIHFEPEEATVKVRLRIHGLLTLYRTLHHPIMTCFMTRLKVLANADITQTRLPQDGRFTFTYSNRHCDCRINFCPTIHGEKVVIRLLDATQHPLQLNELGFIDEQKALFITHLSRAQGLILVTGPTGSGKTQTLYTAINYLNRITTNISTIEDPVEIKLPGINQINIDESIQLTFATALRALLRQDPDVIMVGEIRDQETAELAIRAAQTGHLILATLHTEDAIEAIPRLLNLGISNFNIAATLKLVVAQRLIRQFNNGVLSNRTGIFELLVITPEIQQHIIQQTQSLHLKKWLLAEGFQSLAAQGRYKINQKLTTTEELWRVGIDVKDG